MLVRVLDARLARLAEHDIRRELHGIEKWLAHDWLVDKHAEGVVIVGIWTPAELIRYAMELAAVADRERGTVTAVLVAGPDTPEAGTSARVVDVGTATPVLSHPGEAA